jgi:hypothetical protein
VEPALRVSRSGNAVCWSTVTVSVSAAGTPAPAPAAAPAATGDVTTHTGWPSTVSVCTVTSGDVRHVDNADRSSVANGNSGGVSRSGGPGGRPVSSTPDAWVPSERYWRRVPVVESYATSDVPSDCASRNDPSARQANAAVVVPGAAPAAPAVVVATVPCTVSAFAHAVDTLLATAMASVDGPAACGWRPSRTATSTARVATTARTTMPGRDTRRDDHGSECSREREYVGAARTGRTAGSGRRGVVVEMMG